ncbi:transporter substrate-binding domain-containing protein [Xylanibacter ruminicola]|uniref:histidine kinase n=1 Tax=Xylanibacter ruminicola TaxID=839 RepID=A0A1M6YBX4_XYLRU|nr:transporter substrate-binding domain-containing protein [Xylanibacter ruminicola]SHL15680.1 Signal transduction histidine kinase [Xylanibacter ruminicola]
MKLRLYYILLLITFATAVNADNLGYTQEKPLLLGIDQDYPPLEYVDNNGVPSGVDVEFAKLLMNRMAIPMTFKPNKWAAIAGDVIQGKVDLAMMVYSPYRKDTINYSRAVLRLYYQIVTRKGERKNYGLRDVKKLEIALMQSRPVVDTLKKSGAKIVVVYDLTKAMTDLAAGEYDAVICYRYQAKYLMAKHHLDNLVAEDLTLTPREYCYVSRNKKLIDAINVELDKMEAEGVMEEVYGNVASHFDGLIIPRWVWYALTAFVFAVMVGIIITQNRNKQQLKKALELARDNEEKAKASEEAAKASEEAARKSEEIARANEEKAKQSEELARQSEEAARKSAEIARQNEQKANEAAEAARQSEQKANEAADAARKSEELKDIFMGNMSHSLRTPLNAIIGFSDLLMTMDDNALPREERDNLLQLINKNGLDLLHMINELLSLSDIEGKSQLFQREVTDVDYEMGQYVAEIRPQLHEGVVLEVEEPIDGMRALVDKKLLKVVTMHLLDNAVQHTKEGRIKLTYYVKEGGMYVEVKDTGDGLPEKLKANLFGLLSDRNTYTHDESQENPGLGLSVCKAIIDRCNGKIGARDNAEDGRGTIFWYWTPTEILN